MSLVVFNLVRLCLQVKHLTNTFSENLLCILKESHSYTLHCKTHEDQPSVCKIVLRKKNNWRSNRLECLYQVLSWIFKWLLIFCIMKFFYTLPYFQKKKNVVYETSSLIFDPIPGILRRIFIDQLYLKYYFLCS